MIPIGVYLVWRGFARKKIKSESGDPFAVEKSSGGKIGLGIILVLNSFVGACKEIAKFT